MTLAELTLDVWQRLGLDPANPTEITSTHLRTPGFAPSILVPLEGERVEAQPARVASLGISPAPDVFAAASLGWIGVPTIAKGGGGPAKPRAGRSEHDAPLAHELLWRPAKLHDLEIIRGKIRGEVNGTVTGRLPGCLYTYVICGHVRGDVVGAIEGTARGDVLVAWGRADAREAPTVGGSIVATWHGPGVLAPIAGRMDGLVNAALAWRMDGGADEVDASGDGDIVIEIPEGYDLEIT